MRLRTLFITVALAAVAGSLSTAGTGGTAVTAGNCTFYVGTGQSGCFVYTTAPVTTSGASTSSHALRDDNQAVTTPNCVAADSRLYVWYTDTSTNAFGFAYSPYAACNVRQANPSGVYAKSSCAITAPPPPRSVLGYCFTRW